MQIVLKHPDMLTMGGLGPSERLKWMKENLGLDREQLRAMVLKQPRLLSNSVDGSMAPVVQFLSEELGLSMDKIGAIVRKFPEVSSGILTNWKRASDNKAVIYI